MRDIQVLVPLSIFAGNGEDPVANVQKAVDMAERINVLQNGINGLANEMRDVGKQLQNILEDMDGMKQAQALRQAIRVLKDFRTPLETN